MRYSLTFRDIHWTHLNSTIAVGDSNFAPIKFGSGKGKLGHATPGMKSFSPRIESVDPIACASYHNVVVMVGTNDLRLMSNTDLANEKGQIRELYKCYKGKISQIRKYNSKCRIYICPVLPTKSCIINKRVDLFNSFLFRDLVQSNLGVTLVEGFGQFWDRRTHVLRDSLSKHDELHLNDVSGIRLLVSLIKQAIFRHCKTKRTTSRRTYANTVRGGPPRSL